MAVPVLLFLSGCVILCLSWFSSSSSFWLPPHPTPFFFYTYLPENSTLRGGKGDPRASMSAAAAVAFVAGTDETPCNCCCFPLCPATTEGAIQDSKKNSKNYFFCCSSSSSFLLTAKKEAHISSVTNSSSVSIVLIHRYVTAEFSILILLQINLSLSLSFSLSLSLSFSQHSLSCNNSLWQLKHKTTCFASPLLLLLLVAAA